MNTLMLITVLIGIIATIGTAVMIFLQNRIASNKKMLIWLEENGFLSHPPQLVLTQWNLVTGRKFKTQWKAYFCYEILRIFNKKWRVIYNTNDKSWTLWKNPV